jgi:hypothetical protein
MNSGSESDTTSVTPSGSDTAGSDTESTSVSPGEEVEALVHWARQEPQAQALPCGSPVAGQIADHFGTIFRRGEKEAGAKTNW